LVGGGGDEGKYMDYVISKKNDFSINFVNMITDERHLIDVYKSHDVFVMLSKFETFGVVYIEAISQGLPIIHTKDQGVDGYFDSDNFAFPCEVNSFQSFRNAIFKIKSDYEIMSRCAFESSKKFKWSIISKEYINVYFD